MINPLNVATNGQLRNRNTLQIAALGFLTTRAILNIFISDNEFIWSLGRHGKVWTIPTKRIEQIVPPSRTIWTLLEEDE